VDEAAQQGLSGPLGEGDGFQRAAAGAGAGRIPPLRITPVGWPVQDPAGRQATKGQSLSYSPGTLRAWRAARPSIFAFHGRGPQPRLHALGQPGLVCGDKWHPPGSRPGSATANSHDATGLWDSQPAFLGGSQSCDSNRPQEAPESSTARGALSQRQQPHRLRFLPHCNRDRSDEPRCRRRPASDGSSGDLTARARLYRALASARRLTRVGLPLARFQCLRSSFRRLPRLGTAADRRRARRVPPGQAGAQKARDARPPIYRRPAPLCRNPHPLEHRATAMSPTPASARTLV